MKSANLKIKSGLMIVACGLYMISPAMADKPDFAGKGKGARNEHSERGDRDDRRSEKGGHFEDRHRVAVREYYAEQFRGGHYPPGLAKKNNGCMPPGQARKWQLGRPLPRDVVYYDVPQPLVVQIGIPPAGYRYVRVATDILMVAAATGMVVDAIQDLGR